MIPLSRRLGRTGVALLPIGLSGVPLGGIYERIEERQAASTLEAA